jgi:hypothetical protein
MKVVGPLRLESEILNIGLGLSFSCAVLWHVKAGSCKIDFAESFSSSWFENPVIGVESESKVFYVSLATCSKRTLLLRCLSRWRSLSSGVYMMNALLDLAAWRDPGGISFQWWWTTWQLGPRVFQEVFYSWSCSGLLSWMWKIHLRCS